MDAKEGTSSARFASVVQTCKEISAFHKEEAMRQQLALLERTEREIVAELERRGKAAAAGSAHNAT